MDDKHALSIKEILARFGFLIFVGKSSIAQQAGCRYVHDPWSNPIEGYRGWRVVGEGTESEYTEQCEIMKEYELMPLGTNRDSTFWKVAPLVDGEECYEHAFEQWAGERDAAWRNVPWRHVAYMAFRQGMYLGRRIGISR